jgi:hypothetical protein
MRVIGRATESRFLVFVCICFLLAVSAFGQTIPLIEPPQVLPGYG